MKNQKRLGKLKTSKTVYCIICSQSLKRNVSVMVYSKEAIEEAKKELILKLNKEYTCRICASILKTA